MFSRIAFATVAAVLTLSTPADAKGSSSGGVYVRGYTRSNGTYVAPHIRAAPDKDKSNNFGPSKTPEQRLAPQTRDADKDGVPNYLDKDDNNNGVPDNREPHQYRQSPSR